MSFQMALDGPGKFRRVPTYDIANWRRVRADEAGVAYRPGARTLQLRLAVTLLAGIFAWVFYDMYAGFAAPREARTPAPMVRAEEEVSELEATTARQMDALRGSMSEDEWRTLEANMKAKQAQREAQSRASLKRWGDLRRAGAWGCGAAAGLFAFIAVIAPLSCAWNKVSIERNGRGELVIRKWGVLLPSSKTWPVDAFAGIETVAHEVIAGTRRGNRRMGWRWRVRLIPVMEQGSLGRAAIAVGLTEWGVEFRVLQQRDRPGARPPAHVVEFVRALRGLTGLPASEPSIAEYTPTGRHSGTHRYTTSAGLGMKASEPVVRRRATYDSLEDMPPDVRARVEAMMAEAGEQGQGTRAQHMRIERITMSDSDGQVRTYHSVEEMPPDVRAVYERMRQEHPEA